MPSSIDRRTALPGAADRMPTIAIHMPYASAGIVQWSADGLRFVPATGQRTWATGQFR